MWSSKHLYSVWKHHHIMLSTGYIEKQHWHYKLILYHVRGRSKGHWHEGWSSLPFVSNNHFVFRWVLSEHLLQTTGLPWWLSRKESACNAEGAGDSGSVLGLGGSPGEGNDNPLQCTCLKNPIDRGASWAIVCGVAKSWPWLSTHHQKSATDYSPILGCTWRQCWY